MRKGKLAIVFIIILLKKSKLEIVLKLKSEL